MDEGSTPEAGDRGLSTRDTADILVQRRQERAAPEPAPNQEEVGETDEQITPESLEAEALGEDPVTDEGDEAAGEEPDPETLELDDEGQDADDDPDASEGDEDGEYSFESIDELAEAAGMELDDFLKLKATTVVDGEHGSVTLGELLKGHQLESSFTRKNQAWIEEKRKAETEIQTQREKLNDHFQLTTEIFQSAQQAIVADFESINWQQLQAENPDQYQQLRQQFGMRQGRLNQSIKEATARLKQQSEAQAAEDAQAEQQTLTREHEMLMSKVPEWTDPKVREKDAAEIGKYLTTVGFEAAELENMTDHRLIILARAALGQSGPSKKQIELTRKKLKNVPKVAKPGARNKPRDSGSNGKIAALKGNLKKSGKTDDAAKLLIARQKQRAQNRRRGRSPA